MGKRYILKKDNHDLYDCDWTNSPRWLISPLNRTLTQAVLDDELRSELCLALGKGFPSIHLVLDCKDIEDNVVYIGFEYDDKLIGRDDFIDTEMSFIIGQTINLYLKKKGVDVDSGNASYIIAELIRLCPKLGNFFNIV